LRSQPVRYLRKLRGLRNALVHYGIQERTGATLSRNLPLFGLIETLSQGKSPAMIEGDVQAGLDSVAQALVPLLFPAVRPHGILRPHPSV
jgi:hypothetical protein